MRAGEDAGPDLSVEGWGSKWLAQRQNEDAENDRARLRLHVFPTIGGMRLEDVEPRHVNALAQGWQDKAPRTRRNIYSVLRALFRDAEIEGLVPRGQNPCILTHRQLGKVRDAPGFKRRAAVYSREELVALVSDPRVPSDRRAWYALLGLGMLRTGEAAGLRWGKVEPAEPLARIVIDTSYDKGRTKTEAARWMPAHPTLAAVLAEWRLSGWPLAFGRAPGPEDIVCPVTHEERKGPQKPTGAMRDKNYARKRLVHDLAALGFAHRRAHDLRRTGISLARSDGASKDILAWGTHAPPKSVMDLYTSVEWEALCREVSKLAVRRATSVLPGRPPDGTRTGDANR
jgi:integrase